MIWAITIAVKSFGVFPPLKTDNIVIDSLIFIVLAFVVGHFVQFRSREKTQETIKKKFWNGTFVSNQFLIKDNKFCPDFKRQRYIQLLQEHFNLKSADAQILETPENPEAKTISDGMYRSCLTFITDQKIGEKATKANEYYNFFRGLSTTSFYSTIVFGISFIAILVQRFAESNFSFNAFYKSALIPFLLAIFFGYATRAFQIRAKQRGELHVAEVFDSMAGYFSKES